MKTSLDKLVKDVYTIAVLCNQWGDTGKGKFVDFFSEWADIIARGTGGANAGHTIKINGKTYVFHLIPSGILYDKQGKTNIIGKGVAFDPIIAKKELNVLDEQGQSYDNLRISRDIGIMLPQHLVMDALRELSSDSIGTTLKGIGPFYEDVVGRREITAIDLLNKDVLVKKLKGNLEYKVALLKTFDSEKVKEIMHRKALSDGIFYDPKTLFSVDAIVEAYTKLAQDFRPMLMDTESFLRQSLGKKRILGEGAQGHLLSVDYGTTPYKTGSDCSIEGLSKGIGLRPEDFDLVLGIIKGFYMTRVGGGPFPTELGSRESEIHCEKHTKADELRDYSDAGVNDSDPFRQGIAIRFAGEEYGATTGRPRRTGWLDLPLLRYAMRTNGPNIIATKVDVLNDLEAIPVCTSYIYEGPAVDLGDMVLMPNTPITEMSKSLMKKEIFEKCRPVYEEFDGWKSDISNIREYDKLPLQTRNICDFIESQTCGNIRLISVGPERSQTIVR